MSYKYNPATGNPEVVTPSQWTETAGLLYPTNVTDKVLVGSTTDDGFGGVLQVQGAIYADGAGSYLASQNNGGYSQGFSANTIDPAQGGTYPFGLSVLGGVYGSAWLGNGFLFTNSSTGSRAYGMAMNADTMFYGSVFDNTILSVQSFDGIYDYLATGSLGVGTLNANTKVRVGTSTDDGSGSNLQVDGSGHIYGTSVGYPSGAINPILTIEDASNDFGSVTMRVVGNRTDGSTGWSGRIIAGGNSANFLMGEFTPGAPGDAPLSAPQAWLGGHSGTLDAWIPLHINPDGTQDLYLGDYGVGQRPILTIQNSTGNALLDGKLLIGTTPISDDGSGAALQVSGNINGVTSMGSRYSFGDTLGFGGMFSVQADPSTGYGQTYFTVISPSGTDQMIFTALDGGGARMQVAATNQFMQFTSGYSGDFDVQVQAGAFVTQVGRNQSDPIVWDGVSAVQANGDIRAGLNGADQLWSWASYFGTYATNGTGDNSVDGYSYLNYDSGVAQAGFSVIGDSAMGSDLPGWHIDMYSRDYGTRSRPIQVVPISGNIILSPISAGASGVADDGSGAILQVNGNINSSNYLIGGLPIGVSHWTNDAGYLTSLSGALLATGSVTGATSQAQAFTYGLKTGKIYPSADSTTAVQILKADGTTNILNVNTTNARVGIGITSPQTVLDVAATSPVVDSFGQLFVKSTSTYAIDKGGMIALGGKYNAAGGYCTFGAFGGMKENSTDGSGDGYLFFATSKGIVNIERVRINSDGKLGIATTSPSAWLDVRGTTEQLRLGYDASNYFKTTVAPTGATTFALTGTTPTFTFSQKIIHSAPTNLKGYTVATLPTGVRGDLAYVTDALAPSYLVNIVGGGTVVTPVFYDGTNWVAH